ncbi:MAG: BatD family protein [Flavobacteriaceae bacterium]|jgi:hypothetical protein|nr:BatD family protein [Flavobacteriaceae bacterium]
MKKILIVFFIVFLGVVRITAQITFQAIPQKKEVSLDEPVRIQFILSIKNKEVREIGNIKLPAFTNAQVIGRQVLENHSYDEEGNVIIEYGEEVGLRTLKTGNVKIGEATVVVDGKTYSTKPITVAIVASNNHHEEGIVPSKMGEAFLSLKVSEKNPYQNEGIVAQLNFYTRRIELLNTMTHLVPPNFQGLFVQPVKERSNTYKQEIINGEIYFCSLISSYVMFPSKSGTTVISPFTLTLTVPDGFFNEQEIYIRSTPVTLQVKKLPEDSPEDFYGIVGNYTLKATSSTKKLKTEEAATIRVEIAGKGNIGLVKVPGISATPEGIELFPPKSRLESIPTLEGVIGKISASTVLVPHKGGKYDIKINPFSFFDPQEGIFKKLSADSISLTVVEPVIDKKDSSGFQTIRDSERTETYIPDVPVNDVISKVFDKKEEKFNIPLIILIISIIIATMGIVYFKFIRKNKSGQGKPEEVLPETDGKSKLDKLQFPSKGTDKKDIVSELFQLKKIAEKGEDKKGFYTLLGSLLQEAAYQNLNITKEQFITMSDIEEKLSNKFGDEFSDEWKNMLLKSQIEQYSGLSDKDSLLSGYLKAEELIKKLS